MTAFFSDFFRAQLFANQALMTNAPLRVVLFRNAPDLSEIPASYLAARTVAELDALLGWDELRSIPGYPFETSPGVARTVAVSTRSDVGNSVYVMLTQYLFTGLSAPVGISAIGVIYKGVVGGVTDPLIFVTNTPTGTFLNVHATDALTPQPDLTIPSGAKQWLFGWGKPPVGATQLNLIEGPLAMYQAPPDFEVSNTMHAWLYPQRANMVANPSFEATGTAFWASNGTIARQNVAAPGGGTHSGLFTGSTPLVAESNVFPARLGDNSYDQWTIQLMAKGNGDVKVGLVYWDASYQWTAVDWGVETFTLSPSSWSPISVHRTGYQVKDAMVRIESMGTSLSIDRVLAEGRYLKDWWYFDGDEKYEAPDSFSWYGGSSRQGGSYSMWYGNRRAVTGRLFATDTDPTNPDHLVTDTDVSQWGLVYGWVPAGVLVTPHIEVFYPFDLRAPVPPKGSTVFPRTTNNGRDGGVSNPWV